MEDNGRLQKNRDGSLRNPSAASTSDLRPAFRRGFAELLRASHYARKSQRSRWDFAVEISTLHRLGMTESDCRWLIFAGLAEHAREITRNDDGIRSFLPLSNPSFTKRSCFVLTELGVIAAGELMAPVRNGSHHHVESLQQSHTSCPNGDHSVCDEMIHSLPVVGKTIVPADRIKPTWDSDRRELRANGMLVKQFKWPALNQEMVLRVFQEDDWPSRIDDPLPPQQGQDPKRRLHDTIKCLNRKQFQYLIHFRGDGSGEGIIWEFGEFGQLQTDE